MTDPAFGPESYPKAQLLMPVVSVPIGEPPGPHLQAQLLPRTSSSPRGQGDRESLRQRFGGFSSQPVTFLQLAPWVPALRSSFLWAPHLNCLNSNPVPLTGQWPWPNISISWRSSFLICWWRWQMYPPCRESLWELNKMISHKTLRIGSGTHYLWKVSCLSCSFTEISLTYDVM